MEEGEEVLAVVLGDDVAARSLLVGILPAAISSQKIAVEGVTMTVTHSKSRPSKLYLETRLVMVLTKAVLFASVATAEEK